MEKFLVFIQSIVLSIHTSGSSSGIPENLGLKYDQFVAMDGGCICCEGTGGIESTTGCCGRTCGG